MKFASQIGARIFEIELEKTARGYRANGESEIEIVRAGDGELNLLIDGQPHTVYFAINGAARFIAYDGKTYALNAATRDVSRHDASQPHSDEDAIRAPMPCHRSPKANRLHPDPTQLRERQPTERYPRQSIGHPNPRAMI